MSTAQHTPGPWRAEGWENIIVNAASGVTIVVCPGGSYHAPLTEIQANSRLIAAAPDLLAALREIVSRIDQGSGTATWTAAEHDKLIALINRARGKS